MLDCDVEEQVRRIDTPDRNARLKGSDPEGYRLHRRRTVLLDPPAAEVLRLDTTEDSPQRNAETIYNKLVDRGLELPSTKRAPGTCD